MTAAPTPRQQSNRIGRTINAGVQRLLNLPANPGHNTSKQWLPLLEAYAAHRGIAVTLDRTKQPWKQARAIAAALAKAGVVPHGSSAQDCVLHIVQDKSFSLPSASELEQALTSPLAEPVAVKHAAQAKTVDTSTKAGWEAHVASLWAQYKALPTPAAKAEFFRKHKAFLGLGAQPPIK